MKNRIPFVLGPLLAIASRRVARRPVSGDLAHVKLPHRRLHTRNVGYGAIIVGTRRSTRPLMMKQFRTPTHTPEPTSAPGDFYVENECCISCGVPQAVAPDLVGWTDDSEMSHCRWKKQPSTYGELQQAFAIFDGQEVGCHRYAGIDPEIQQRVGIENCDYPLPSLGRRVAVSIKRRLAVWSENWHRKRRGP
jgi:hypothetical protein